MYRAPPPPLGAACGLSGVFAPPELIELIVFGPRELSPSPRSGGPVPPRAGGDGWSGEAGRQPLDGCHHGGLAGWVGGAHGYGWFLGGSFPMNHAMGGWCIISLGGGSEVQPRPCNTMKEREKQTGESFRASKPVRNNGNLWEEAGFGTGSELGSIPKLSYQRFRSLRTSGYCCRYPCGNCAASVEVGLYQYAVRKPINRAVC